jgi:hypothetical protein
MESLDQVCNRHTADKGSQWHNFCVRYAPHLEPLRGEAFNLLEVGIQFGCSAGFWLEAFPNAQIYGVDIRKDHSIDNPRFHFEIGDQRDWKFWAEWRQRNPEMRVIIDDAEHRADASRAMFNALWGHLSLGGVYAIEDVCTWWDFSFSSPVIGESWIGELASTLNWHGHSYGGKPVPEPDFKPSYMEESIDSIHLSKHLIILRKKWA